MTCQRSGVLDTGNDDGLWLFCSDEDKEPGKKCEFTKYLGFDVTLDDVKRAEREHHGRRP